MRLAIITTHPIQYYAPVFRLLHTREKISIMVFYTWGELAKDKFDPGFGKTVNWDIPLLDGYPYQWVRNTADNPGSNHFYGIVTPDLTGQVKAWKPDAVLIYGWAYQSHLKALRHFNNRIPVYFRGDSTLLDENSSLKQILKHLFLRWVYKHVDHAFYVGTNNRAYFRKFGLQENQLSFAPHAIDNDRFAEDKYTEAIALRKKIGVKESELLILFAGKFEDKKSPLLLLNAFLSIKKPDIHLLYSGNGALETQLKEKAGNNMRVHFIDFQNQSAMPAVYQACDLFCLPSQGPGETWGLAINEAMACGKAVLVSDRVGCGVDLVKEGINGSIFKSTDINDLTIKLDKLTDSKETLAAYGDHSRLLIKDWNFLKIAEAIEYKLIKGA